MTLDTFHPLPYSDAMSDRTPDPKPSERLVPPDLEGDTLIAAMETELYEWPPSTKALWAAVKHAKAKAKAKGARTAPSDSPIGQRQACLAAEACIDALRTDPDQNLWWLSLGSMGGAYWHDKMADAVAAALASEEAAPPQPTEPAARRLRAVSGVRDRWMERSKALSKADDRRAESWRYDLAAAGKIMEKQAVEIERLTRERDAEIRVADMARAALVADGPPPLGELAGLVSRLRKRAEAAEAEAERLTREVWGGKVEQPELDDAEPSAPPDGDAARGAKLAAKDSIQLVPCVPVQDYRDLLARVEQLEAAP